MIEKKKYQPTKERKRYENKMYEIRKIIREFKLSPGEKLNKIYNEN